MVAVAAARVRNAWSQRSFAEIAPNAICVLAIVGSFVGYLALNSKLWFFGDDWDYLVKRPLTHNTLHSLLAPHNEHWSTIPILTYRLLYSLFGMHHYLVFEAPVLLMHAGSCIVLWLLMKRSGANPWAIAVAVVLVAMNGAGAENLTWDFQIGFVGSVFFGLLAVLVLDGDEFSRARLGWTWLLLVLALMCSGMGVPMLVAAAVFAALKHGGRAGIATFSLPAVVFALWYVTYGHRGGTHDHVTLTQRLKSAQYIFQGLTNTWEANTNIPSSGALLFVAIAIPVVLAGMRDRLGRLALALMAGEVGLFVITGWTRVQFGITQADASRYVYVSTILTVVAAMWSASALFRFAERQAGKPLSAPLIVAAVLTIALTLVSMTAQLHQLFSDRRALTRDTRADVLSVAALVRAKAPLVGCCPIPQNPDLSLQALGRPGVLSALPSFTPDPGQLLAARGLAQVYVRAGHRIAPMQGTLTLNSTGQSRADGGCLTGRADASQPAVITDESGTASVTVTTTGRIYTRLNYNGSSGPAETWSAPPPVAGGLPGTVVVSLSQPGAMLAIYTDPGTQLVICRA